MSDMTDLLKVEGDKIFGNDMHIAQFLEKDEGFLLESLRRMAEALYRGVWMSGYRLKPETHKIIYGDAESGDPMSQTALLAVKLRAAFTCEPAQFVAFCGYKLDEARREADGLRTDNTRLRLILAENNLSEYEDDEE